jgi:lysophospholipase L1-like esterase
MKDKFSGFQEKVKGMTEHYRDTLEANHIDHIELGEHTSLSSIDGTHLDREAHGKIAEIVADWVNRRLEGL